jgi:YggT family protein
MVLLDILDMLLGAIASVLVNALLLRAYLGWLRFSRTNPVGVFCAALTDWLVLPLRRVLPFAGRLDSASLAGAILIAVAYVFPLHVLRFYGSANWYLAAPGALLLVVHWALYLVVALVIVNALFSLINPHAPLAPTFDVLTRPLLAPVRRHLPPVGGFDLSPVVVLVVAQILLYLLGQIVI